jgi:hypothetical protein
MNKNILNITELHNIADLANARRRALQQLDIEMCIATVIKPECQENAREGYYHAIVTRASIEAYNPNHNDMFGDVLRVLSNEGVQYEVLSSGNLKIIF